MTTLARSLLVAGCAAGLIALSTAAAAACPGHPMHSAEIPAFVASLDKTSASLSTPEDAAAATAETTATEVELVPTAGTAEPAAPAK